MHIDKQSTQQQLGLVFLSKSKMEYLDPDWGIKGASDLVIEIVPSSSYKRDHVDKKALYAQHSIAEHWIVDPSYASIQIYTLQDGAYTLHAFGVAEETVSSKVLPEFSLVVSSIL